MQHGTRGGLCIYFSTAAELYRVHDHPIILRVGIYLYNLAFRI
jgi:hypothetical protein